MTQEYFARRFFDGDSIKENVSFSVENGVVADLTAHTEPSAEAMQLTGLVTPGFIDVQVNGGGGALFNQSPTLEAIQTMSQAHQKYGTTGLFPTVITDDVEVMKQAADAVSSAIQSNQHDVLGIHFEGPHLSVERKGVHAEQHIRPLSEQELALFTRKDLGKVIVTLAPENVSCDDISTLTQQGVLVCLGHSNANYEQVCKALDAGACGFTHLFNAMSPMQSREPGMVGAALLDQHSWCGVIVDGYHVHGASLQLAIRAKSKGKILLVTDAMPPVGSDEPSFSLYGQEIIRTGDRLNAVTGELAGSVLDMAGAVRNTVNTLGVELEEALRMAAKYPAEFAQLDTRVGQLKVGQKANFVVLNEALEVEQTWLAGECRYHR